MIAIVCDCDDTLTTDTTNYLLEQNGVDVDAFWNRNSQLVIDGWDPPIAWMTEILSLINSGKIEQNTNDALTKLGSTIVPNPGLVEFIHDMHSLVQNEPLFKRSNIVLEFYIISSGFEAIIRGAPFAKYFKDIFGGTFAEDIKTKQITAIKSSVTFTEKTKFLYAINKGISGAELRKDPFLVNQKIPYEKRDIPFEHMLYIGDSRSDIPCFSALKQHGGQSVGIAANSEFRTGHILAHERRMTMGPYRGNYESGSDLYCALETSIKSIGYTIVNETTSIL